MDGHLDLAHAAAQDRELLAAGAGQLTATAALLGGQDPSLDVDRVRRASAASAAHQQKLAGDPADVRAAAALAAHAQSIALAAQAGLADALIASGKASPELVEAERNRWYGLPDGAVRRHAPGLAGAAGFLAGHASLRSVWFRNSARGSVAIAAAVAVASLSGVQHGFWVALGTLSVLRTTAASTGSTAMRALLGTAVGFVAGALLLLAIGTGPAALWTVLPFAVFIASYAPGTAPFAVGQAAFTVTIVVIFNLLAPAGWQVGLLRIEDVAIGCAVSLVVGAAFWPRGRPRTWPASTTVSPRRSDRPGTHHRRMRYWPPRTVLTTPTGWPARATRHRTTAPTCSGLASTSTIWLSEGRRSRSRPRRWGRHGNGPGGARERGGRKPSGGGNGGGSVRGDIRRGHQAAHRHGAPRAAARDPAV